MTEANPFHASMDAQKTSAGAHIQWLHLNYSVPIKMKGTAGSSKTITTTMRTLLDDISGQVAPGQLLALMGASGAGKSTLLNVIAQRIRGVDGSITCNGVPVDASFKRICGYVTQDTPFLEALTVRETLQFTAEFRLPQRMSSADKSARVQRVIERLDLVKCANTRVGWPAYPGGISGGERRRLALAMELLFEPAVLICDEVTSGLDAASASRIVGILRQLADEDSTTVICTIHQPRSNILTMFDNVMLLSAGKVVYFGPSWKPDSGNAGLLGHFREAGFPLPEYENPADAILDLVNGDAEASTENGANESSVIISVQTLEDGSPATPEAVTADKPASSRDAITAQLIKHYRNTQLYAQSLVAPAALPPMPQPKYGSIAKPYATGWLKQFATIVKRTFLYKLRMPDAMLTQFIGSVFIAVIIGTVFWRLPLTAAGVRDRFSAISFLILTQSFVAFDLVVLAPHERAVMLRDSASGMYSTGAFYMGRTAAEFPVHSAFACIVGIITYWMFGLVDEAGKFFTYVGIMILVTQAGASMLLLVGSVSKTMAMGNALATIVLVFASLFNGFFIHPDNTPRAYRWITDISFPAFGVKAAVVNEFTGLTYYCDPLDAELGCTGSGDVLLQSVGFQNVQIWWMCVATMIEIIVMRILAYAALHFLYTSQTFKERLRLLLGR